MITTDAALKQKMTKDGSLAKHIHGQIGVGKGLIAAGIMLIFIGAMLGFAMSAVLDPSRAMILGGPIAAVGVLLLLLGMGRHKKRMGNWLSGFAKDRGFSEDEVRQLDQEFLSPDTILYSFNKGTGADSLKGMGFMTPHYFRFPEGGPIIRASELAACFYSNNYRYADGGSGRAFKAYSHAMDEVHYYPFFKQSPNEKAAMEIVEEVSRRYPSVITSYRFRYGDRVYDASKDVKAVIELHKKLTEENR